MTYKTILADPPWRYSNWKRKTNGAAESAMETMSTADIVQIPVERWCDREGAFLVLWATFPKLEDALAVMEGWGFSYVTGFPWVKTVPSSGRIKTGIGFWTHGAAELILIGRKSRVKSKLPKRKPNAPRVVGLLSGDYTFWSPHTGKHSKKPLELRQWISQTMPGPYLELFARDRAEGWDAVGLDLGTRLGPSGVTFETGCLACGVNYHQAVTPCGEPVDPWHRCVRLL